MNEENHGNMADIVEKIKQAEQDKMRAAMKPIFDKHAPKNAFPVLGTDSREEVFNSLTQIFINDYSADALIIFLNEIRIQLSRCQDISSADKGHIIDALIEAALEFRSWLEKQKPAVQEDAKIYDFKKK
ncbi:MAG: hypothetical protein HZC05_04170 [Candidatus Magasanikbacteria bacterium]|nr:hypothetical protein [Candidatus Magasanikbacteria bacterium]